MAIVPLPLSQNVQARALLHHLLEHGDIVGRDAAEPRSFSWRSTTGSSRR